MEYMTMQVPVYTIANKGKFTQDNPIAAVRFLGVVGAGKCLILFATKQAALDYIALNQISDDTVPLQITNKAEFLRLLNHAKRIGIRKTVEAPTETGGEFADIDSWLRDNQQ